MSSTMQAKLKQARRLHKAGELDRSIGLYRKLLKKTPDSAHLNLGMARVLRDAGQTRPAVSHFNAAIKFGLRGADVFAEFADLLNGLQQFAEAETMARAAVALDSAYLPGLRQLLKVLLPQRRSGEALAIAEQLVTLSPNSVEDRVLVAWSCSTAERYTPAIEQAHKAIELDPSAHEAFYVLARVHMSVQKWQDALHFTEQALALRPDSAEYIAMKADLLEHEGEVEQAYDLIAPLLEGPEPAISTAVHVFARLAKKLGKQEQALQLLEQLAGRATANSATRTATLTLLASLHDSRGEYDKAFAAIDQANRIRPSNYSDDAMAEHIERLKSWFTRERLQQSVRTGSQIARPIFIVGMPRSGTSLTEKILSRHPDVIACGETIHLPFLLYKDLPQLLGGELGFPECLQALTPEIAERAASIYLDNLHSQAGDGGCRVTDKRPMNFMYLGAIAQLFPEASIVHCTRDPMDTGLSCYFANFASASELGFSQDLAQIGHYYQRYAELMRYWQEVLPVPIHDCSYEALVTNPQEEIRRLLEFCGLPWHDACLRPHESSQTTMTASYEQVRNPINSQSVGRWKNYARHLEPLREIVAQDRSQAA